jgi:hypothetical protein
MQVGTLSQNEGKQWIGDGNSGEISTFTSCAEDRSNSTASWNARVITIALSSPRSECDRDPPSVALAKRNQKD